MSCIASRSNAHTYCISFFFFFNDTATTEIYTLSLHDALPICQLQRAPEPPVHFDEARLGCAVVPELDHPRAVPRQGGEQPGRRRLEALIERGGASQTASRSRRPDVPDALVCKPGHGPAAGRQPR